MAGKNAQRAASSKTGGGGPSGSRDRAQIVIALGEGKAGAERVQALRAAADREGITLSEWARERLLAAAGLPPVSPLAARLPALEQRLSKLERLAVTVEV